MNKILGIMFDLASFLETTDKDVQEVKDFASGVESLKMQVVDSIQFSDLLITTAYITIFSALSF